MMIHSNILLLAYGLASAASWGAADFSGGFATKHTNVYTVILLSQIVGVSFLLGCALLSAEVFPATVDLLFGSIAGISAALGLAVFYRGLAQGQMSIVAPVTAMIAAVIPVLFSLLIEGLPSVSNMLGCGLALISVWLLSGAERTDSALRFQDLRLPIIAGLGFAVFFIFIDQIDDNALFWPLIAARFASISLFSLIVMKRQILTIPGKKHLGIIALAGLGDTGGNAFFALATQIGRLDVSTILSSLYPAATVMLAWGLLRERFTGRQWVGFIVTLFALILIAV